jgi:hypothetical protein
VGVTVHHEIPPLLIGMSTFKVCEKPNNVMFKREKQKNRFYFRQNERKKKNKGGIF